MNMMKLIEANRAATIPASEQWTVRGWPNGMAVFHRDNCRCCNNYVAHIIRTCREQSVNLPLQAVGNTVTTVWPMLMHDLESQART
jgi:hypothetical protein